VLELMVDEQFPEEVRSDEIVVHRLRDVVADHREADQLAALRVVDRPRVRHRALLIISLGEDVLDRVEVPILTGAEAQAHDRGAVSGTHNVAQPDCSHSRLLHTLKRPRLQSGGGPAQYRKSTALADRSRPSWTGAPVQQPDAVRLAVPVRQAVW